MEKMTNTNLFNTPFEMGVRALLLLETIEKPITLENLIFLDYMLLHSGDFHNSPESIHADIPYRKGELLVKRVVLLNSLELFLSKGVLIKKFTPNGIYFAQNDLTSAFLNFFKSQYFVQLREIALWIKNSVPNDSEKEMNTYFKNTFSLDDGQFEFRKERL